MRKFYSLVLLIIAVASSLTVSAQGLKGFKLKNGLSVYIWEDSTKNDVFGLVGVKVGAVNDPEDLTGLAHYLEHMMFKGTQSISSLNWEKEKPLYEQIITKYDEMANEPDPVKKEAISLEINKLTVEAAQYTAPNEFAELTENMGGKMLNAMTGYDETMYFSSFPPSQLYKWLDLNSERFINPVFRAFQPELETVYEEFNRSQDMQGSLQQDFMLKHIFPGHPYSRSVLGLQEHLKNPRLGGLVDFYNNWYVPENMVLILVGNVKLKEAMGLINDRFGRLEAQKSPERKSYPEMEIKGRTEYSAKMGDFPTLRLAFKGVPTGHTDELALTICVNMLSNRNRTGLLDKLSLSGDVLGADAGLINFKEQGRILILGIPYYDVNQRRFESIKSLEKMLLAEISKIQKGEFDEELFNSVKATLIRDFDLSFESSYNKAQKILSTFICNEDISNVLNYKEKVKTISIDQVKAIANKYFNKNYIALNYQPGKAPKAEKLSKPKYDPINPERGVISQYAEKFRKLPVRKVDPVYEKFDAVQVKKVNERSRLFYTQNKENAIFTLTLKYGVGTHEMPQLQYAVDLMNNAGIMGAYEPQALKQEFNALGAVCNFGVDDNYLYVSMSGYEENLEASCNLLTRQILMPKLDEKQLNNMIGSAYQMRAIEEKNENLLEGALHDYLLYQNKSEYLDRMPLEDIINLTISSLTGEFNRATDYEAEIHYVGSMPFNDVYDILSKNLPLKATEKTSNSPVVKDRVQYKENTIYFVSDNDALQSKIYFYVEGNPFKVEDDVYYKAFNKYFGSGFGGLVMQEVREYRSMAYTADGGEITPPLANKNAYFEGYIGTQADKTIDAIDVFMNLLTEMPEYADRISGIKDYLREGLQTAKPDFRSRSQVYEAWKRLGYTEDPAKTQLPKIQNLSFEDVVKFYQQNVKGRPVAIGIIGDPKRINLDELSKYGKVIRINKNKLFSSK